MIGFGVLTRKELLESWRTYRLPVVAGLFLVIGILSPLTARFLPEIVKAAAGDQLGNLGLPPPVPADAADQLWKNLAQFGAFVAIILAMGAVSVERDRGTAAFVLVKTSSRGGFIGAKVLAIGILLGLAIAIAVVVGWIYTTILFEPMSPGGWAAMAVLAWLSVSAWAAITFLGSTVTGSTAAAAGIGFASLIGLSLVSAIPNVGRFTPGGLTTPALALATGQPVDPTDLVVPVVSTVILIAVTVGISAWSFARQEV